MTVTKRQIAEQFGIDEPKVCPQGNKQLFIVDALNYRILVSYQTIVGIYLNYTWYITNKKYSVTTERQLNWFIDKTSHSAIRIDENDLLALLEDNSCA
jgi:hypothetical protein